MTRWKIPGHERRIDRPVDPGDQVPDELEICQPDRDALDFAPVSPARPAVTVPVWYPLGWPRSAGVRTECQGGKRHSKKVADIWAFAENNR